MTPSQYKQAKMEEFDKKFCFDPAETFFGNREKLKAEGWEVGESDLMIKQNIGPKDVKSFMLSFAESYSNLVLDEIWEIANKEESLKEVRAFLRHKLEERKK